MLLFRSSRTRGISKKMLGHMKPSEIVELIEDSEVSGSDVPAWVDLMIREYCKMFVERCNFHDTRFENRFPNAVSLIHKIAKYRHVWVNWDGLEPFPWREERLIKYYFDSNVERRERHYGRVDYGTL